MLVSIARIDAAKAQRESSRPSSFEIRNRAWRESFVLHHRMEAVMPMLDTILDRMLGAADREIPPSVQLAWRMGIGATDSPEGFSVEAMAEQRVEQPMPLAERLGEHGTPAQEATRVLGDSGRRVVDVAAVMDDKRERYGETLDWRHSISDLLALLGLDSSVSSREQLAHELDYPGDIRDRMEMDAWLHGEVLRKIAEKGGELPIDLLPRESLPDEPDFS
jgi:hypothetical protein